MSGAGEEEVYEEPDKLVTDAGHAGGYELTPCPAYGTSEQLSDNNFKFNK